jgi:Plasmid pRiA4b ORF-3-like protein
VRLEQILPIEPGRYYPVCIGGRRAAPPEDCGGPWAFLELRQHYSAFRIADRLLELLKPITSGAGQEGDDVDEHADDDDDNDDDDNAVDDHYEELVHLLRWLKIDRFDRRAANGELARIATAGVA